jgi:3',5'-nucleoside bisphosphate phosphatase
VIDLHTHSTASDGRTTPAHLVARAARRGVAVLSLTDHDTVAGCSEAAIAARAASIEFVPGIEMTAVVDGADVHVLGYFIDTQSADLLDFLAGQRQRRIERVRQMLAKLETNGIALDADAIIAPAIVDPQRTVGRPWIARALVAAGHVADSNEAFEKWLGRGKAAFVPRTGAAPPEVIERIHAGGGIASLAHPILIGRDELIPAWVDAGLDAIEAYHTDHGDEAVAHYVALAGRLGVLVSGGSDYHGDEKHGGEPGSVSLPAHAYAALRAHASR